MITVFIHGANASNKGWTYLNDKVKPEKYLYLDYNCSYSFAGNLKLMINTLNKQDINESFFFVGHSLGGVYALYLGQACGNRCVGGFTLATPYGGSTAADTLRYWMFPKVQLFKDIGVYSSVIQDCLLIKPIVEWTAIVTTSGHSLLMHEPNDGVVTLTSMKANRYLTYVENASTHHEVLQDPEVAILLKSKLEMFYV